MFDFNLTFIWYRFIIVLIATLVAFNWVFKRNSKIEKFYFLSLASLVFIYSGAGSGWEDTPGEYTLIYSVYILVLGLVCHLTMVNHHNKLNNSVKDEEKYRKIEKIINKYGKAVIILYISIPLVDLVLAGKISNLISPPSLNLQDALDAHNDGGSNTYIGSILYYLKQFVLPFYLLSLYKYKDNILKLSIALLSPLYITFALTGYLSRSGILPFLIIIFVACYVKYPKVRRKMILGTIIGLPLILFVLSWFTFVRIGREIDIPFGKAITLLVYQESAYPIQYEQIQKWDFDGNLLYTYFDWLIKLPFPGFLKSTDLDYEFNAYFTEKLIGGSRTDQYFSIALPGLVGEGVFIFGKYLFWLHAALVGLVVGTAYKLVHHKQELFLVLYMGVFAGVSFARAGTVSAYPFYFKHLIIYLIVLYLLTTQGKKINGNNCNYQKQ